MSQYSLLFIFLKPISQDMENKLSGKTDCRKKSHTTVLHVEYLLWECVILSTPNWKYLCVVM